MKILTLVNLYPPHHAGTHDLRCQAVMDALRLRGHTVRILTSNHGLRSEQRDAEIERRLQLNGAFGHPLVTGFGPLRALELHNHEALRQCLQDFQPDLAHVWSLRGLSNSLFLTLQALRIPSVFDVADDWISRGLAQDPWLRWWNRPGSQLVRAGLELSGARTRLDRVAPTRPHAGCDRLPDLYGDTGTPPAPDSITDFRFERIFFSSLTLRVATQNAGFPVGHADVIPPGITSETFVSEVKPMGTPITRFLVACPLQSASGVMTALKALKATRDRGLRFKLGIYGRGESDYVPQLRSFVVQNQLPVEFLPVSDLNRDVVKIYRQHDAFLYTSEEEEPFATTILEAMASGLPVIGSWIGCVREFLRHGENAFIYAPGEDLELASRMEELHRQPALRHQMAETAQAETMAQFSFSTNVDRVEAYLEQTLEYWRQTGGTPVDPVPD